MTGNVSDTAIVFDLGAVLIDWNPRHLYRKLFDGDEQKMEWFLENICTSDWNEQQDAGRTLAEATEMLVQQHPEYESLIRAFYGRWIEMVGGAIEPTVQILTALKEKGYDVHALSNWSAETFPLVESQFPFLGWFDVRVISGEIKLAKPDIKIFEHLLREIGRPANECLFIDDNLRNIKAAGNLGFDTIHFQSPAQLQQELEKRQIL